MIVPSTSAAFRKAILGSYTSTAKVEWWNGSTLVASTDRERDGVVLRGGSVDIDRTAAVRRTLTLDVMIEDKSLFVNKLDPIYGYSIKPYRGVVLADGTKEYVQLGEFKAVNYGNRETGGALLTTLKAYDLSYSISRNKWSAPYQVTSGTNYMDAIKAIAEDRASGFDIVFNAPTVTDTTPDMFFSERDDPWKAMTDIALGIGYELYFDYAGALTAEKTPDPATQPALIDITDGGVRISDIERSGDLTDTYNGVIVRASAPWLLFPIEGEAWDDDPTSPTWREGPFGEAPKVIDDPVVTSVPQCEAAALTELRKILGKAEEISFETLVDPRVDGGAVIVLRESASNVISRHVVQTYRIPLVSGSSSGTVRTQSKVYGS